MGSALFCFFLLSYGIAWGGYFLVSEIAKQSGVTTDSLLVAAENLQFDELPHNLSVSPWIVYGITRIVDFSFSIAGVAMIAWFDGVAGLRVLLSRLTRWRFPPRVYLVAFLPLALFVASVLVTAATNNEIFDKIDLSPRAIQLILFGAHSGLLVYLFTRGPFGEELGLRGFALPRLQERFSPFGAASIIGVFWALWHLPVLLGRSPVSITVFLLVAFSLSYIFTWLFNSSGGSLIPCLLFHTTQNAEEIWEVVFPNIKAVDWELTSTLSLLLIGFGFAFVLWRQGRSSLLEKPGSGQS